MRSAQTFTRLLVTISAIALTACSGGPKQGVETKTDAPIPPITTLDKTIPDNYPSQPMPLTASDTLTPVVAAPQTPAKLAGETTTVETTTTTVTPAVVPPPAVTPSTIEERMAKLEQTVGSLRSDYDRIMPAFASLNTTNERIQTLLNEIEEETGKKPAEAPVKEPVAAKPVITPLKEMPKAAVVKKTTPESKKETAATETKAETGAEAANTVSGLRIGEHGTKTRLVFDLASNAKPEYKSDLDNGEKLLLIDMPASNWSGKESGKPAGSAFVDSWSVEKGADGGSTIAIQLKKEAKILSSVFLKAEGKDPGRLVIDIGSGT